MTFVDVLKVLDASQSPKMAPADPIWAFWANLEEKGSIFFRCGCLCSK